MHRTHHAMVGQLAAQYTKALVHDHRAPIQVNMREAVIQTPLVNAAPELLEALIEYVDDLETDLTPHNQRYQRARLAIDKAQGRIVE